MAIFHHLRGEPDSLMHTDGVGLQGLSCASPPSLHNRSTVAACSGLTRTDCVAL